MVLVMEAIILIGLQASGKSTFCAQRYFDSHVRINLDMLKTRNRERKLLQYCLETQMPFVVDNTNPSAEERAVYIQPAKQVGFRVIGYYFRSAFEECLQRNDQRTGKQRIPIAGLRGTASRMELPSMTEGFDALRYVRIDETGSFVVEEWNDEVR